MSRTTVWIFGAFLLAVSIGSTLSLSVGRKTSTVNDLQQNIENPMVYVKASIPVKIFRCITQLNILRCMRIFILQRMERTPLHKSGNLTVDFLDRILSAEDTDNQNLWNSELARLSDAELNVRLQTAFQSFFSNREIKLFFIPGIVVKVRPSVDSYLNFTIKKSMNLNAKQNSLNNPIYNRTFISQTNQKRSLSNRDGPNNLKTRLMAQEMAKENPTSMLNMLCSSECPL